MKRISNGFRSLDFFTEEVKFGFIRGQTKFKTKVGAVCSLLMTFGVLSFALARFVKMVSREDTTVKREVVEGFFETNHIFTTNENEFALAFGLVEYGVPLPEDFSEYGELRSYYRAWDASKGSDDEHPLKFRICRPDDFSTDPKKPAKYFNTLDKGQSKFMTDFKIKMYCSDSPSFTF